MYFGGKKKNKATTTMNWSLISKKKLVVILITQKLNAIIEKLKKAKQNEKNINMMLVVCNKVFLYYEKFNSFGCEMKGNKIKRMRVSFSLSCFITGMSN